LILDEPTSGLDPLMQKIFFDILLEENKRGTTILFSSHVLSEVQKICDRVVILKEGRIIDTLNISDLRKQGYKKVSITTEGTIQEKDLISDGIQDLEVSENSASFIYMGGIPALLDKLKSMNTSDVFIEEPTLEEIFLFFYK